MWSCVWDAHAAVVVVAGHGWVLAGLAKNLDVGRVDIEARGFVGGRSGGGVGVLLGAHGSDDAHDGDGDGQRHAGKGARRHDKRRSVEVAEGEGAVRSEEVSTSDELDE